MRREIVSFRKLVACFAILGFGATSAEAQMMTESSPDNLFILSDDTGRGMTIGRQVDSRDAFVAADMSGEQAAALFKTICLDTQFDKRAVSATAEANGFTRRQIVLPALRKDVEFRFEDFTTASSRASYWPGDDAGLKNRPIAIRTRGAIVMSGYGPFKASGQQCNLDVALADLASVDGLAAALQATLGKAPAKLVSKDGFGDGYWITTQNDIPVRVSFDAIKLKRPPVLVHMVIQQVQDKAAK